MYLGPIYTQHQVRGETILTQEGWLIYCTVGHWKSWSCPGGRCFSLYALSIDCCPSPTYQCHYEGWFLSLVYLAGGKEVNYWRRLYLKLLCPIVCTTTFIHTRNSNNSVCLTRYIALLNARYCTGYLSQTALTTA